MGTVSMVTAVATGAANALPPELLVNVAIFVVLATTVVVSGAEN